MSRPEHLHVPNTAEGISRINQEQAYYDLDPDRYERDLLRQQELRQEEQQREYEEYQQYLNKQNYE